jgi:F-type H+-transporting ATPase subunit epsilon
MSDSAAPVPDAPTAGRLLVAVVTPEGTAFEGEATHVVVPSHDGEVAFYAQHAPFVGALGVGELRIHEPDDTTSRWFVEGGVAQVLDDVVTVLAEHVKPVEDVDAEGAREDLAKGLDAVPTSDAEFEARDRLLDSARARLRFTE